MPIAVIFNSGVETLLAAVKEVEDNERIENEKQRTEKVLTDLETLDKEIFQKFREFSATIGKIQNCERKEIINEVGVGLPTYCEDLLKNANKYFAENTTGFLTILRMSNRNYIASRVNSVTYDGCYNLSEVNKKPNRVQSDVAHRYLEELKNIAITYKKSIDTVYEKYKEESDQFSYIVDDLQKDDWKQFSGMEKKTVRDALLLLGLLYEMCWMSLVESGEYGEINPINYTEIEKTINKANLVMEEIGDL